MLNKIKFNDKYFIRRKTYPQIFSDNKSACVHCSSILDEITTLHERYTHLEKKFKELELKFIEFENKNNIFNLSPITPSTEVIIIEPLPTQENTFFNMTILSINSDK